MKHLLVLVIVAACGKANDMPAMKVEAESLMKSYAARFDELDRRATSIMQRGNAIGVTSPDAQNASRLFAQAKGKLEVVRADIQKAPSDIAAYKAKLELRKYIDRTVKGLKDAHIEINADFDAVEAWITYAEAGMQQVARRDPAVPPPPPPPPGNPGQQGAGGTAPSR